METSWGLGGDSVGLSAVNTTELGLWIPLGLVLFIRTGLWTDGGLSTPFCLSHEGEEIRCFEHHWTSDSSVVSQKAECVP